eukprot:CAMPEP_0179029572 /NCGR_PEP_ID=MMETSP0796-20121207/10126_1 /TAXON_ID=73915 /ORGANISM="Pyrodinium bahamense, Strain pbaha01" /LENGTH=35 /DNA_ID= /DNA_START= /DNA_END= /DNA_ORIENTATION=
MTSFSCSATSSGPSRGLKMRSVGVVEGKDPAAEAA